MATMENIYRPEAADHQAECGGGTIFEGWLYTHKGQVGVPLTPGEGVWVNMASADMQLPTSREEIQIPKHSGEASSSPYWRSWRAAMEAEIHENLKIGVGLIEQRPEAAHGHTLINTTWVYSTKLKDGEVVFKARLTARGDQEDPANINDDHRASPTADQDSIRLILAELANMQGAKLMSFDFFSPWKSSGTNMKKNRPNTSRWLR